MPSFEDLAYTSLTDSIVDQVRPINQVLGPADQDLVHLINRQPAALSQVFGQGFDIAESRPQRAVQFIELIGRQKALFAKHVDER